jgi:hypothetical protein
MAYDRKQLRHVSAGYWRYKTADTHATVDSAGYFNEDGSPLKLGDIIDVLVVTNIDAANEATSTYGRHLVNSVTRGNPDVVDVSDVTVGTATDTD